MSATETTADHRTRWHASSLSLSVALGVAMATVPYLVKDPGELGWVLVGVCAVATMSWRGAATIVAMAAPAAVGLPWPVHCLTAAAAWYAWPGASRAVFTTWPRLDLRALTVISGVGALSAAAAVAAQFWLGGGGPLSIAAARPSLALLALAVLGAALTNALGEELMWRGVLADAAPLLPTTFAYTLQGGSFGLAHAFGIPSGPVGMVFAGVYSLVVFALSRRLGPGAALVTHFVTDLVLFTVVAATASFAFVLSSG